MEYRVLGPFEVRDGDRTVDIPGLKEKALLALLLVELATVVSTDRIVFELWGDEPPTSAAATVRSLVSRLRRYIGKETIVAQRPGYRINVEPGAVDSHLFEKLADEAVRYKGGAGSAHAIANEAIALWRGSALSDFAGFQFAENEARRLEHRKIAVLEILFDSGLRLGHHHDLVPRLREVVGQNPLHEPFYGKLMIALYRSGRTADALGVYSELETLLGEELGIKPSQEVRSIERSIVMEDDSLDLDRPDTPHNLSTALTTFIGRERELDSLAAALPDRRLVTLTGPGGSGKSRLAHETATRLLGSYPDGVWRVELAPLRDPDSVVPAIAGVFGDPASHAADPLSSLTDLLDDNRVLLLLDNCEHLLSASSHATATILDRCPRVTIMATSREPLGIAGESVWLVPPLHTPDPQEPRAEQENAEAVRLFSSRAADAASDFGLSEENAEHVFEICRLVDGLPLALELAAARVSSFPVKTLAERLANDLGVLTAPRGSVEARHQTMSAALDWSYRLLDSRSSEVFGKLAVFRGGWTTEDAESILGASSTEVVADLVDRSLVERLRSGRLDYRLLEPIREYAGERFRLLPDHDAVSSRHAQSYLDLARRAEEGLRGPAQREWLHLMEEEHDNLRKAMSYALDAGDSRTALQLVAALGLFWFMAGHWKESWDWLTRSLDQAGDSHPEERAAAVYRTGAIQVIRANHEAVMPKVNEALEICLANGDRYGEAWCRHLIGHAGASEAPEDALVSLTQARDIFSELGCVWEVAWSDRFIGAALCDIDRAERGLHLMLSSTSTFRELGDQSETAYGLYLLGGNLIVLDDYGPDAARPYLLRCLRLSEQTGDRVWAAHAMSRLGLAALRSGEDDAEALLREAAERHRLIGDDICLASVYGYLGDLRQDAGDEKEAAGFFAHSIRVAERIHSLRSIASDFDRIARLALKRGRVDEARRLVMAVETALDDGLPPHPIYDSIHTEVLALIDPPPTRGESVESLIPLALETAESIREERPGSEVT